MIRTMKAAIALGGFVIVAAMFVLADAVMAHPGGLAKDGAHRDKETGERHWHLVVPCVADPCNPGFIDATILERMDPTPPGCAGLLDAIGREFDKSYWNRNESRIVESVRRGVLIGCWRVPRVPDG